MNTYKIIIKSFVVILCLMFGVLPTDLYAQTRFINDELELGGLENNSFVPGCDSVAGFKVKEINKDNITVSWIHPTTDHIIKYKIKWQDLQTGVVGNVDILADANMPNLDKSFKINNLEESHYYQISIVASCNLSANANSLLGPWADGEMKTVTAVTITKTCDPPTVTIVTEYNKFSVNSPTNNFPFSTTFYMRVFSFEEKEYIYNGSLQFINAYEILKPCSKYQVEVWSSCEINGKNETSGIASHRIETKCCGTLKNLTLKEVYDNNFVINWELSPYSPTNVIVVEVGVFKKSDSSKVGGRRLGVLNYPDGKMSLSYYQEVFAYTDPFTQQYMGIGLLPQTEYFVTLTPICSGYTSTDVLRIDFKTEEVNHCAVPTDFKVDNIFTDKATASWKQKASNIFKAYKLVLYNVNTVIEEKWVSPATYNAAELDQLFENLSPNTDYVVHLSTYCCNNNSCCIANPSDMSCTDWEEHKDVLVTAFHTKPEPCPVTNPTISSTSTTEIEVSWQEVTNQAQRYTLSLIDEKSDFIKKDTINGFKQAGKQHIYKFSNLTPNTKYVIQFISECYVSSWVSGESKNFDVKTSVEANNTCSPGTTFTTTVGFESFIINWQSTNLTPLNENGRRFIISTKSNDPSILVEPKSNFVVYQDVTTNSVEVKGLKPSTSYSITLVEAFDVVTNSWDYTNACTPQVFNFTTKSKSELCDDAIILTPQCATENKLIFKVENKTKDNITFKVHYREISAYLKSQNPSLTMPCGVLNPVVTSTKVSPDIAWETVKMTEIKKDNIGSLFILNGLAPCSYYEVVVQQYQSINGYEQPCKTYTFPDYFATTDVTVSFTDNNKDGIPSSCDPNDTAVVETPSTTQANSLPETKCGDPKPDPSGNQTTITPTVGQLLTINAIPFEVTKISATAPFNGEGILGLPFQGQRLLVTFSSITVNEKYEVLSGTVNGMRTDKTQISKVISDINKFNAEHQSSFCNKPQEEGFVNGINTATGMPVDQNGFDASGQYGKIPPYPGYVPGLPFDPNYSPDGKDKDGVQKMPAPPAPPCEKDKPYCWLQQSPNTTIAGTGLYDKIKGNLIADILKILNNAKQEGEKNKAIFEPKCSKIRSEMESILTNNLSNYEPILVTGKDKAWLNQGMSRYFGKVPLPFSVNMERSEHLKNFEAKHIDLFSCDVDLTDAIDLIAVVEELSKKPVLTTLENGIAFKIQRLSTSEAQDLQDPIKFAIWLNKEIDAVIKEHIRGRNQQVIKKTTSIFDKEEGDIRLGEARKSNVKIPFSIASDNSSITQNLLAEYHLNPQQAADDEEAMLQFEFEQGFTTVGGIHRAFILQDIDQKRRIRQALNMEEDVTGTTGTGMPISIVKEIAGKEQAVYLDNLTFTPGQAKADIFVVVTTESKQMVFQIQDLTFDRSGFIGDVKLGLASDIGFPINNIALIKLKGATNSTETYVTVDCDGFKKLKVKAEIEFCRDYLIPLDPTTLNELPEPNKVKATFETKEISSFNDILVNEISITDFALKKHPETKFKLEKAVLDFSDFQNSSNVTFPEGYFTAFSDKDASGTTNVPTPLWRGVFIKKFAVTLPKKLTFGDSGNANADPVKVEADNLIIDEAGVSGKATIKAPILTMDKGKLGGWAFSIEECTIGVLKNRLNEGSFAGMIHVPITKKSTVNYFQYRAAVLPYDQYQFVLNPLSNIDIDIWKAKATFKSDSKIIIDYKKLKESDTEKKFVATAILNGDLTIGDGSSSFASIDGIHFEKLTLSNYPNYFKGGKWTMPKVGAKLKGFEIEVKNINVRNGANNPNDVFLDFDISVVLGSEQKVAGTNDPPTTSDDQKFKLAAGGSFTLEGKVQEVNGTQKYEYHSLAINKISIDGRVPGAKFSGSIEFFPKPGELVDTTFGEGFSGGIWVEVDGLAGMGATATFGRKKKLNGNDTYKYFIVDVLAKFDKGIPMGPVDLKAAGGGIYWKMTKKSVDKPNLVFNTNVGSIPPGGTMTGDIYEPHENKSIGIRLLAGIASAGNEKSFNLNVLFEIAFNNNYGIDKVSLKGVANFMRVPDVTASSVDSLVDDSFRGIKAGIYMLYDVPKKTFHANLSVNMRIAGGAVEGCGPGYKVGEAELHFEPKVWYINIGRTDPQRKEFLSVGIGIPTSGVSGGQASGQPCAGKFKFETYFSIGNSIPPMAPLPDWAAKLLGEGLTTTDQSIRANGRGFAFGARTGFGFDKETKVGKWGVYAQVRFDLGFDMMLMDYGNKLCQHDNGRVGINGWYASGQVFARLEGAVGVVYKSKRFPILSAGIALVMKAQGPSPFWAKGAANVHYSILGIFKGSRTMRFEIGTKCQMVDDKNSPPDNNDPEDAIIAVITPDNAAKDVSLRAKPRVEFNVPIGKTVKLVEDDPNKDDVQIESNVTSYIISKSITRKNGTSIDGVWEFNSSNSIITFKPYQMLPNDDEVTIKIKVNTEQDYTNVNWATNNVPEEKSVTFKTEGSLAYIPEDNISGSYPINGMYNYYREELNEDAGYIQLIYRQDDLLQAVPEGYYLGARLYANNKRVAQFPCEYLPANARIKYNMPNKLLKPSTIYKMTIGWIPVDCDDEAIIIRTNNGNNTNAAAVSGESTGCQTSKVVYTMYFRVSSHSRLFDKLKNASITAQVVPNKPYLYNLNIYGVYEPFDAFEVGQVSSKFPLITVDDETLKGSSFVSVVDTAIYRKFPTSVNGYPVNKKSEHNSSTFFGEKIQLRNINNLVAPFVDISFYEGKSATPPFTGYGFVYNKFNTAFEDYEQVKRELNSLSSKYSTDAYDNCNKTYSGNCVNDYYNLRKHIQNRDFDRSIANFPSLPTQFKLSIKYKPIVESIPTGDAYYDSQKLNAAPSSSVVEKIINR